MFSNDRRGKRCNSGLRCSILRLLRQVPSSTTRRSCAGSCRAAGSIAAESMASEPGTELCAEALATLSASPAGCAGYNKMACLGPGVGAEFGDAWGIQGPVNHVRSVSGSNTSPVSRRLCAKLRCNKRALPLALLTSIGCCKISTSTVCAVRAAQWQMQLACARRQVAHMGRVIC